MTASLSNVPMALFQTYDASGSAVVNNVNGVQHIVYETNNAPPTPHALDFLKLLNPVTMDATSRPHCLEGTRTAILQILTDNLTSTTLETNVLWLHGVAGSGKSTIATTIAEQFRNRGQHGAFLFFNRNSPAQSEPNGVIRTLAYQLAMTNVVLMGAIFIILDAFDECGDPQSRKALLHLLSRQLASLPHQYRFLITSRPESDLKNAFGHHPLVKCVSLGAAEWLSAADVYSYIEHEIDQLYWMRRSDDELPPGWPGVYRIQQIGVRAGDSFIWAATAVRYLHAADDLDERLDRLLTQQAFSLGDLYATALRSVSNWEPTEASTELCRKVLGAIVVGKVPLNDDTMAAIIEPGNSKSCRRVLRKLGCLVQWSDGLPARTLHASFADYITDPHACGDQPWFIDKSKHHAEFTAGCFRVMQRLLHFNICELGTSYLMNRDVFDLAKRIDAYVPQSLAYACRFSFEHLKNSNTIDRQVHEMILTFFKSQFLYWLEVLSLVGESRAALQAMSDVEGLRQGEIREFPQDSLKFIRAFGTVILDSAPHIYISALPFSPSASVLKQQYSSIIQGTLSIPRGIELHWPSCEQVIEGHTRGVTSVAVSPEGMRIASGSDDQTVRVWDTQTGELIAGPSEGHTGYITSVTFSPEGMRVASGSDDKTIRVWDAQTVELIAGPFKGHQDHVNSVAFAPNGEYIASGSEDGTLCIWDAHTGELIAGPFNEFQYAVTSISFSPDGVRVASGLHNNIVCVWNIWTGRVVAGPFIGHTEDVTSVAFSPDGDRVASGSRDWSIRIWDA
ncbi:hypothetical protein HWV62_25250 [Athelia sp. TMB]|nr:hypothetical protein HWV62_25250 [Athelia sp. TMB]